jgi:hypothetical protein
MITLRDTIEIKAPPEQIIDFFLNVMKKSAASPKAIRLLFNYWKVLQIITKFQP